MEERESKASKVPKDVISFKPEPERPQGGLGGRSRQVPVPVLVWQEVTARFAALGIHIAACQRAEMPVLAGHKNPIGMKLLERPFLDLGETPFLLSVFGRSWPCFPAFSRGLVLTLGAASWGFASNRSTPFWSEARAEEMLRKVWDDI